MLAFKPARVSTTALILFAVILAVVAVVSSVAHPQTASAQVCGSGYTWNGSQCAPGGAGVGTCVYGTAGCVNGVCTAGYVSNGVGGCTLLGATGACVVGGAGCINGVCTTGYVANGVGGCTLLNASTTCVAGTAGCVNGVCITGYVPNGAGGCIQSVTPNAATNCTAGSSGCVNGVCTPGYVSTGVGGCTLLGATGTAISGTPVQTPLNTGCDLVVVAFGAGATPQQVVTATANPSAVQSIWGWDNTRQRWMGFFPGQAVASSDLQTLPARAAVFVCVSSATTLTAP